MPCNKQILVISDLKIETSNFSSRDLILLQINYQSLYDLEHKFYQLHYSGEKGKLHFNWKWNLKKNNDRHLLFPKLRIAHGKSQKWENAIYW